MAKRSTKAGIALSGAADPSVNARAHDAARHKVLHSYEIAVQLLQSGKYGKAYDHFQQMLDGSPQEFADRIRMYMAACERQREAPDLSFQTAAEQCDYAFFLLNDRRYKEARLHFSEILKLNSHADDALYGLALVASSVGNTEKCIEHLAEAVRINPKNRFQARSDSEFETVADDPRFTELIYPSDEMAGE